MQSQRKTTNKNNKPTPRVLSPFENEILVLSAKANQKNVSLLLEKIPSLLVRIPFESEKTHPSYLTMLCLMAAQCISFQAENISIVHRDNFVQAALQYMKDNQLLLQGKTDMEWQKNRDNIMDIFDMHIKVLLLQLSSILEDPCIRSTLYVICTDYKESESEVLINFTRNTWLTKESCAEILKCFLTMKNVMSQIRNYFASLKNFHDYYSESHCHEASVLYHLLDVVLSHALKSLKGYFQFAPSLDQSAFNNVDKDMVQAVKRCSNYLVSAQYEIKTIDWNLLSYLVMLANRLVKIRDSSASYCDNFSQLLHRKLVEPTVKNTISTIAHIHYQQFYFDLIALLGDYSPFIEEWRYLNQQISESLQKSTEPPYDMTLKAAHMITTWQQMADVMSLILRRLYQYAGYKTKHFTDMSKIKMMSNYQEIIKPSAARRLLQEVNEMLAKVKIEIWSLKELKIPESPDIPRFLIPLNAMNYFLIRALHILLQFDNLPNSQYEETIHEQHLSSFNRRNDLCMLETCYTDLKEILLFFSKNYLWFMHGLDVANEFVTFVEKYLNPRLASIAAKKSEEDQKLIEYQARCQKDNIRSKYMAHRFMEQENALRRLRQKRRCEQLQSVEDVFSKHAQTSQKQSLVIQNDSQDEDHSVPFSKEQRLHEEADKIFDEAMRAFSGGLYYKASEWYTKLGAVSDDYLLKSKEGVFVCQVEIAMRELMLLRRTLKAILASGGKVFPADADACTESASRLQKSCDLLFREYTSLLGAISTCTERVHVDFLKDRRHDLAQALEDVTALKKAVLQQFSISRYEKIMWLGFSGNVSDPKEQQKLFEFGRVQYVDGKKLNKNDSFYKRFKKIYDAGYKDFVAQGEKNQKNFGVSPYASVRNALVNLNNMIQTATQTFHSDATSSSISSSSITNHTTSVSHETTLSSLSLTNSTMNTSTTTVEFEPFTDAMSVNTLVERLRDSSFYDQAEINILIAWVKKNKSGLFMACQQGLLERELAYECFCSWVLTTALKERIAFLNETGLLRWFLSIEGDGALITPIKYYGFYQHIDSIVTSLKSIPSVKWHVDLILAEVLSAILVAAFDQAWLLNNMMEHDLVNASFQKMCDTLHLSKTCERALHAKLSAHCQRKIVSESQLQQVWKVATLYDDPDLLIRLLIACDQSKSPLSNADSVKLSTLLHKECTTARQEKRGFLKPIFKPDVLLDFLLNYCLSRSAEKYLMTAYHYALLPLILPVPLAVFPCAHKMGESLAIALRQFDQEHIYTQSTQWDESMLLGKLIATIFYTLTALSKDRKSLMSAALQELQQFLPNQPTLMRAVEHHVSVYDLTHNESSLTVSASITLMPPASNVAQLPSLNPERKPLASSHSM